MTRRSARRTGSGRHPVRSFRSSSICASHPVLRASMSPWSAGRRARGRSDCWRLRRAAPTAPYPGASIAAPVELILAVQGADQAAEPPQKPWAVCISPREVTNPNSRPNATHESASPESHSPETGVRRWDSRYRAAHRRLRWARKSTRVRRCGFATRMVGFRGSRDGTRLSTGFERPPSSGAGGTGLARGIERKKMRREHPARHPDQRLVVGTFSPFRLSVQRRSGPGRPQRGPIVRRKAERR